AFSCGEPASTSPENALGAGPSALRSIDGPVICPCTDVWHVAWEGIRDYQGRTLRLTPFGVRRQDLRSSLSASAAEKPGEYMNAVEIEEAISALAEQPFDPAEFPWRFLQAFGNKDTTLKRLRAGHTNSSDV